MIKPEHIDSGFKLQWNVSDVYFAVPACFKISSAK